MEKLKGTIYIYIFYLIFFSHMDSRKIVDEEYSYGTEPNEANSHLN